MELQGLSSLSPRMPSSYHHKRLSLSSSFLGSRVENQQPNSIISGVQLRKSNIPTKRCTTIYRFSVSSILADVAEDFMVTSTPALIEI